MADGLEGPRDRERLRTVVVADPDDLAALLADRIVAAIRRGGKSRYAPTFRYSELHVK